jgi:hypothetical protein
VSKWPTTCERTVRTGVGANAPARRCRRPARYLFCGHVALTPKYVAMCVQHSLRAGLYLAEGALPGWVERVVDLKTSEPFPLPGDRIEVIATGSAMLGEKGTVVDAWLTSLAVVFPGSPLRLAFAPGEVKVLA